MKKKLLLTIVFGLLLLTFSTALAGGGPNGTWVQFSGCDSYWRKTGSGLAHEWRSDSSCAWEGYVGLHLVFKPMSKFSSPDCDADGHLNTLYGWEFTYQYNESFQGDEGDLADFLTPYQPYYVCFYSWDHAELP